MYMQITFISRFRAVRKCSCVEVNTVHARREELGFILHLQLGSVQNVDSLIDF